MEPSEPTHEQLLAQLDELSQRLDDAEQTLEAIRSGEVDAVVVDFEGGQRIFTLEGSHEAYRTLVEQMQEGAVTLDSSGFILYCNRRFAHIMRVPMEALVGSALGDRVMDADRSAYDRLFEIARAGEARGELLLRAGDGGVIPAHLSAAALPVNGMNTVFLVVTDLRERKRNEQLMANERLARAVFDHAAEAIIVCDESGTIIRLNDVAREMCPPGAVGQAFESAFLLDPGQPDSPARSAWRAAIERAATIRGIEATLRCSGSRLDVQLSAGPLYLDGDRPAGCIITLTDISARKDVERQLDAAKRQAEEASQAKDQFLAILSHELRTPLTPVLATAQMMQADAALPASCREPVDMIRRNVELESRLIDDLLDITRIEHGKLQIRPEPLDVHRKIKSVVEMCRGDLEARGLCVELGLDAEAHHVRGDAARIQQVFWNLLKNAVKFTPEHGRISIRTRDQAGDAPMVVAEVSDTGIGIAPEDLPRLFRAFEQVGARAGRPMGGLGLGLAISRALVELHGGSIAAHSDGPGRGAVFTVTLPTCTQAERDPDAGPPRDHAKRPRRILLVEDHADTARVMAQILRLEGHSVDIAPSKADALEAARQTPYDLLVSDLGLPDGSGLELMRQLQQEHPIRGIAVSGYGMEKDLAGSREAGFSAHIVKPVNVQALLGAIQDLAGED